MAMGRDEARRIKEQLPDIEYMFIYMDEDGNYQTDCSAGFDRYLLK